MTTTVHAAATDPVILADRAYDAFERGDLQASADGFAALLDVRETADAHYMLGLVHKYLGNWALSLRHNLRSMILRGEFDEAAAWNAGVAATALRDWAEARRQWARCGIELPPGDGPIVSDFGIASIRLNPWGDSETLFARRIDPVRARLLNVPLPESGYRYGDVVLHDGAPTGSRRADGIDVPVFNVLARLVPSDFRTHTAFVRCETPEAAAALAGACGPGIGTIEDWTHTISHYCPRCSAGEPHDDDEQCDGAPASDQMRTFGVAAQSRRAVEKMLRDWKADGPGRGLESIESREHPTPFPEPRIAWWRLPEDIGQG